VYLFAGAASISACNIGEIPEPVVQIASLILGSFIIGVYQGFYCHPRLQVLYIGTVCLGVATSALLAAIPKFRNDAYLPLRNSIYVATAAFGVVPLAHWAILCAQHSEGVCDPAFFEAAVVMLLLYGFGFALYHFKFPERHWPGSFDVLFNSHNLVRCVVGDARVWLCWYWK
jgi:adiponectin receptor